MLTAGMLFLLLTLPSPFISFVLACLPCELLLLVLTRRGLFMNGLNGEKEQMNGLWPIKVAGRSLFSL